MMYKIHNRQVDMDVSAQLLPFFYSPVPEDIHLVSTTSVQLHSLLKQLLPPYYPGLERAWRGPTPISVYGQL